MKEIFLDYQCEKITGNVTLAEEYAKRNDVPILWVECENITVQQLINRILDDYEEAGFDLDNLPMENVLEKFVTYKPKISIPKEYIQLQDAKLFIEKQIESTEVNEHTLDAISQMKQILDSVIVAMKELK